MLASDKLKSVSESYYVYKYDNGYMIEISGRDLNDEWETSKIVASSFDEVIEILKDIDAMPRVS